MREDWTFKDLIAAGWSEADLEWERRTEDSLSALAEGRVDEARAGFANALRLARAGFAANDPRLAASLSNQAAAVATENGSGTGQIRAAAAQAWSACDSWIDKMTAPRTARSSMFHLRMERLHRPAYEERWRVKGRELLADVREEVCADETLEFVGRHEAAERVARWHRERPVTLSDPRKLMAAVILLAAREKRFGINGDALPREEGRLQQQ
ncbi:hypothetical protein [Mesorhizobium sp. Root157]|uniref:hypothetical protein n=1 Tax=Mesorhizobium sp. Root157 TaxID=1736477 RepID=UPI0012E3DE05|nr:hypothetical protein [Mesorhizobium sp. Root157]